MATKITRWPTFAPKEEPKVASVEQQKPKRKKVVKKEIVIEPTPIVEEEMTIEDVLTALEKKSQ